MAEPDRHVVLLGDSILDNGAYTDGGPDVTAQLRAHVPCTLAARDGSVVADVPGQLARAPDAATHLVISAGGNDALRYEHVLAAPAASVAAALALLGEVAGHFRAQYGVMLDAVTRRALPTAVCTIYDPRFPEPERQRLAVAGLALFNDAIIREAFARGLAVIDLRLICAEPGDLANPIEPSSRGGVKIAAAIARFATAPAGLRVLP
ncbi:MAG TPA: SGNH/GDSL hydrolase family protein [Acetobacteraceae bacterium]|nr:SGNH/GDSL hydrolase family protein [Acetobacteraceae bacterium]